MIKVIFFDIDNTLIDFDKCAESSMRLSCAEHDIDFNKTFLDTFHSVNNKLWKEIEKGRLTIKELYRIRWDLIFEKLEIAKNGVSFEKTFLSHLEKSGENVDGAKDVLEYMSKKYTVCAASNAPYKQQVKRLTNGGLINYFDKLFISEKVGYEKPSRDFFDVCFKEFPSLSPKEAVMIGDSPTADIDGGQKYGMITCLFDPKDKYRESENRADHILKALCEIKNIF